MALSRLPGRLSDWRFWAIPVALFGGVFTLVAPLGLPYDEPSHWQNVMHVASAWSLPVVGRDIDITHEGVQAPLSYVWFACAARIAGLLGGDESLQFYVARAFALPWLWMACSATERLVRLCSPHLSLAAARCGVAIALLNPMVLAVASSVQNDVPALALGLWALYASMTDRRWTSPLTGALIGLALLTKATMWPVAVVAGVYILRRGGFRPAATTTGVACAVCGWWIVRNLLLYGDPTGASAISRIGVSFPPLGWDGLSTVVHLSRSAVTFLWIPVEYYRNTLAAPLWIEALVLLATTVVLLAGRHGLTARTPAAWAVLAASAIAVAAWVLTTVWVEGSSFRIAYISLAAWATLAATACQHRWSAGLLLASTTTLPIWSIWSLAVA